MRALVILLALVFVSACNGATSPHSFTAPDTYTPPTVDCSLIGTLPCQQAPTVVTQPAPPAITPVTPPNPPYVPPFTPTPDSLRVGITCSSSVHGQPALCNVSVLVWGSATSVPITAVSSVSWGWGDGTVTTSGVVASHLYPQGGFYPVSATVTANVPSVGVESGQVQIELAVQ